jgi:hypothetical protein
MTPENRNPPLPEWALRERQTDMAWIRENLPTFWSTARTGYDAWGRGAIVVNIAPRPPGEGYPYGYALQTELDLGENERVKQMVRDYNPQQELVVVLLKSEERNSTYRIWVRPRPS